MQSTGVRSSPRARAAATRIAPALRVVERSGYWPRLFRAIGRRQHPVVLGFGEYQPDEHDVVVATYEKSGTNWMLQLVHQLATSGTGEFEHVHDVAPWPDGPSNLIPAVPLSLPTWQGTDAGLRPVKTHLARSGVPLTDAGRYVVVVRDPKDVLVSQYHFIRAILLGPLMPSPATWLDLFLGEDGFGEGRGGPWPEHVDGWWRERHRPNVLVLRYEEMLADLPAAIRQVAQLMRVELDDLALQRVHENSTFSAMRRIERCFSLGPLTPLGEPGGAMLRRGVAGDAKELLTADQRERIDDHCQRALVRLGSDFPYGQVYRRK